MIGARPFGPSGVVGDIASSLRLVAFGCSVPGVRAATIPKFSEANFSYENPCRGKKVKRLCAIPSESLDHLRQNKETGIGYQIVSVELKDGRRFDQVIASEGCIIQVRGYDDIPFAPHEVAFVAVSHRDWNFREYSDVRRFEKSRTAGA